MLRSADDIHIIQSNGFLIGVHSHVDQFQCGLCVQNIVGAALVETGTVAGQGVEMDVVQAHGHGLRSDPDQIAHSKIGLYIVGKNGGIGIEKNFVLDSLILSEDEKYILKNCLMAVNTNNTRALIKKLNL